VALLPADGGPGGLVDAELVGDGAVLGETDVLGVAFAFAEAAGGGVWLGQFPDGVALACCRDVAEALELALCWGSGEAVELGLGLGLLLVLALVLVLVAELAPPLTVPGLVAAVAGVVVWVAGLLGCVFAETAVAGVCPVAWDDVQVEATAGVLPPVGTLYGVAPAPFGWPGPVPVERDVPPCEVRPISVPSSWRTVGTAASTTPTANTANPTAKAGRSMASRQSRDRRGACPACPGFARWADGAVRPPPCACQRRTMAACQRRTRATRKPRPADRSMAASRNLLAVA
jgi:hypothetical protein